MAAKMLSFGVPVISINAALPSNGTAGTEFAVPNSTSRGPLTIGWQVAVTGTFDAISNALQGSIDGTTWVTLDSDTTVTGIIKFVAGAAIKFLRVYHTSHTNGTTITATILVI